MILQGTFGGLDVCVQDTDGNRLIEYQVQHHPEKGEMPERTECFLECENGKEFEVVVALPPNWKGKDLSCRTYIDGRKLEGTLLYRTRGKLVKKELTDVTGDVPVSRRLCFGELPVTDDSNSVTMGNKDLQDLGQIRIDLCEGVIGEAVGTSEAMGAKDVTVHESSKKGVLGSVIKGGTATPWEAVTIRDFEPVRRPRKIEHRVVFKYRTRQLLMASRVIDLPSTPPPSAPGKRKRSESENTSIDVSSDVEEGPIRPKKKVRDDETQGRIRALRAELNALTRGEDIKPGLKELMRKGVGTIDAPIDLTEDD